jgi:perosamine synthetase
MIPVARPSIGQDELRAIAEVFASNWLGLGEKTKLFEGALKSYLGCKHVVAVNTGTTALHLALDALGVCAGDEVIVPSLTFAATIQAIVQTGATPVFCDILEDSLNLDPVKAGELVTPRTKAVVAVHYRGEPCDMDALLGLGLPLVEDAAHAFGSFYKGRRIGSFGHLTCFSFDPIKTITTMEGGAVATADDALAELMTRKRFLGIDRDSWARYANRRVFEYDVTTSGFRYHMPNVNAAVGLVQIAKAESFIASRREAVKRYQEAFAGAPGLLPLCVGECDSTAFFCYIVKVEPDRRARFMEHLKQRGVGSGIHYIPNHRHSFFRGCPRGDLTATERAEGRIVTLPLYNGITPDETGRVIDAVLSFN